jgi:hypothetical protein
MATRTIMLPLWCALLALMAVPAFADVSVIASVDRNRMGLGESLTYTIAVSGAQGGVQAQTPRVDGLAFNGPSQNTSMSMVNGQISESFSLVYQVTASRMGEWTIPSVTVTVGGRQFQTQPITITVEKGPPEDDLQQRLFGRVQIDAQQVYVGQVVPINVDIYVRQDVPFKGIGDYEPQADGLNYNFLHNLQSGQDVVNGENFSVYRVAGAISSGQAGRMMFGPCTVKARLVVKRQGNNGWPFNDSMFDQLMGNIEVREVPVIIDAVPIDVLPLPEQGRPADFAGAVGRWRLEASAKPTEVAVGDPITLNVKITGTGNIDTVPALKLGGLDDFKTYDPTTKTTRNELGTQGERDFQQVLIAKDATVKQLPEIRLAYFDPVAQQYQTASQNPIPLVVKAGAGGGPTIVGGGTAVRAAEKLGQDIVYLKGDLGPAPATAPFCSTPGFWLLNCLPIASLAGLTVWKRRADRLRGDVAYARRSRAAGNARKRLAGARDFDQIQRALQEYLGDRLNIPDSGITASVIDEQLVPRGLDGGVVARLKACFEACDTARFAGLDNNEAAMRATADNVKELIDELETIRL